MMFILYVNSSCPRGRSSFPTNSQTKVATGSSITSYVCTYIHTYIPLRAAPATVAIFKTHVMYYTYNTVLTYVL